MDGWGVGGRDQGSAWLARWLDFSIASSRRRRRQIARCGSSGGPKSALLIPLPRILAPLKLPLPRFKAIAAPLFRRCQANRHENSTTSRFLPTSTFVIEIVIEKGERESEAKSTPVSVLIFIHGSALKKSELKEVPALPRAVADGSSVHGAAERRPFHTDRMDVCIREKCLLPSGI